ncbi:Fe-Mn family superoxide dismutase [Blochmannia endosymbiont of Camponotus (Colobopsis) obliquus]|uniref:Fe-Mn family superoxide dismutase n=1 Tax=Blochmannia endosymbiont of Camponotus (Colobopsis) obliquus TaxID=1505597 RepID=UPI00061A5C0C|nr:Fe-Mn family superoxide dismutase [Blochmannia endosymbiont of Camponotus (Colobopsis) obliquus]AKC60206.1 superoxide dismutase [Mn] [Blochmannia endosymbiont of Camponotus (Colobopsis) obliquus]
MHFILPLLPYSYDAMEPFIDRKTMELHHTKHHQTYINKTNETLVELPSFTNLTIEELIKKINSLPEDKKTLLRNNAGGHINHTLFWSFLKKQTILHGNLKKAIEKKFNNIEIFKMEFEKHAINRFGSGWIWLIKNSNNELLITSTGNQDNPLMEKEIIGFNNSGYPIIGLDVWEHAYYLKYQNRRLDYVKAFWNILNWDEAELRFNHSITI